MPASGKEEEKKQPTPTPSVAQFSVEEPILSQYAQNNYWKVGNQYSIKDLENDYA